MNKIIVDIDNIQIKLCEKFKKSGWYDKMKGFILSSDFENIIKKLVEESNKGKKFTPILKYVFRAFEECKYSDLKVVFLSQDVYPQIGVADGIAFSSSLTNNETSSLKYIFNSIEEQYQLENYERNPDLKRWANQGVLLINCGMTCEINNVGSHIYLWKSFISYLLDILNSYNTGLIFVFMGTEAQKYSELINQKNNYVFNIDHPNKAYYTDKKRWNNKNIFKEIDKILLKNNNEKIIW